MMLVPRYEIIPLKSAQQAIADLPPAAEVSITCSPAKGIEATLELAAQVAAAGHHAVPHIAARMVDGPEGVRHIAGRLRSSGITELFVIAGDQTPPAGPYSDALTFLGELLNTEHGLRTVGVGGYPDGHALIDHRLLHEALIAKTQLIESAGLQSFVSTQMCFDASKTIKWAEYYRTAGVQSAIHLGLPGVVDRTKLLTLGAKLGIGTSLKFLTKNRKSITKLLSSSQYDPSDLLNDVLPHAERLGISGLHLFTFNEVGATAVFMRSLSDALAAS